MRELCLKCHLYSFSGDVILHFIVSYIKHIYYLIAQF